MNKVKKAFFCSNCGTEHSKWQGQCNSCKSWNTLVEEIIKNPNKKEWKSKNINGYSSKPIHISPTSKNISPQPKIQVQNQKYKFRHPKYKSRHPKSYVSKENYEKYTKFRKLY